MCLLLAVSVMIAAEVTDLWIFEPALIIWIRSRVQAQMGVKR